MRAILRAVAGAAQRWSDGDFPPRVRLLEKIADRTGYSAPVVEYALDRLFFSLDEAALAATIVAELGSLDVLDRFVERGGLPHARALPIGRACIISSRTTIGVAIVPAVFALCAKCDVLVKDREDGLVRAFFATLHEELDELAESARAQSWDGERDAVDLHAYDAVAVFGTDATIARVRALTRPGARFVAYAAKASAGYVGRDALASEAAARELAEAAARDVLLYDGEGCLSLHALFVERGGSIAPERFAALLAAAIERTAIEFPPSRANADSSARVAAARDLASFRAAGGTGAVYSDARASYLAVLDPPLGEPPAFLPRSLAIHSTGSPQEMLEYLHAHRLALEALALAGVREELQAAALASGAARIARFGELQDPPLGGYHGGRPRIAEFVRWVTQDA